MRNVTAFCQLLLRPIISAFLADTDISVKPKYQPIDWSISSVKPVNFFVLGVFQRKSTLMFFIPTHISPENLRPIKQEISKIFSLALNNFTMSRPHSSMQLVVRFNMIPFLCLLFCKENLYECSSSFKSFFLKI